METLRAVALFLLLPILLAEPVVRLKHRNLLQRFGDRVARAPIDVVLAGSSRVAAALDEATLSEALSTPRHPHPEIVNLGRGYSRPHDKALALRVLLEEHPEHLRGAWLLIEAPAGIPDPATWRSTWAVEQEPGLIAAFLSPRDWWRMATLSETPPTLVAQIGLYRVSRTLLALRKLRDATDLALAAWRPRLPADAPPTTETLLTSAGGILSHAPAVQAARDSVAAPGPETHPALPAFESTIWGEIARLARSHDMKVALFEPPMSAPDEAHVLSEYARGAREARAIDLRAAGLELRPSARRFEDGDFPDQLHLRADFMIPYTRAFAAQFRKAAPDAF